MDNLHYRRTFDLDNKNEIPGKNLLKVVKFQNLVEKYVMCGKYSLTKFCKFSHVLRAKILTTFGSKMVTLSARNTIIRKFANFARLYFRRILEHFATKFWNFTCFETFFPGISFFFVWIWLDKKLVYN